MMTETAKPSLLLPSGATISVIAAVLEGLGEAGPAAQALAAGGALAALAAWALALRKSGVSASLGVRFLSTLAIALAISSLFVGVAAGWLGTVGVAGLWIAAGGAGVEWVRGRTYDGED